MTPWKDAVPPPPRPAITARGWALIALRAPLWGVVTYGGLLLLLLVRVIERPLFGMSRPITPFITQGVCKAAFPIIGLRRRVRGRPMHHRGAIVANHCSWLDIFALNACDRVYFVAKSEVAGWAGIGWLARATGTVFIRRKGADAKAQQAALEARLRAGHRLLFFPEGTSSDGLRVLPFKSTLFSAFYGHGIDDFLHVQPVSVIYTAPARENPAVYGWWADMSFGAHFLTVLSRLRQGQVEVVFHDPVRVSAYASRKELALACERAVRVPFAALPPPPVAAQISR